MLIKFKETREIPLTELCIADGQVRLSGVTTDIHELASNIAAVGLIQPIFVRETDLAGYKYEIVAGQRRFLAHMELQRGTILCHILDESNGKYSLEDIKMFSLSENLVRTDLARTDIINACTALFYKYGTIQAVADGIGLPYSRVSQYVKFAQLTPELKSMVESAQVNLQTALNAQNAANQVGGDDVLGNAVKFAIEMSPLANATQKNLTKTVVNAISAGTQAPIESIIEESKALSKVVSVTVSLGPDILARLDAFASEEGTNRDGAAFELIEDALGTKGY